MEAGSERGSRLSMVLSAALVISLIVVGIEYLEVSDLQSQNIRLRSEVSSYSSIPTNGGSLDLVNAWLSHLATLESLKPDEAIAAYTDNSSVMVTGLPMTGIDGTYAGLNGVTNSLSLLFGNASTSPSLSSVAIHARALQFHIESYRTLELGRHNATIEANLSINGSSSLWGNFEGTIQSTFLYNYQDNAWLLSHEVWNFTTFVAQYPAGP